MKELTKEQLAQEMKGHKQKMQLNFVDDLLDRVEHLSEKTSGDDYDASYEELLKILAIRKYVNAALKNIGYEK